MYLNACSPVGIAGWEALGGMVFLEQVYHRGHALKFQKPMPATDTSFCLVVVSEDVSSQLLPHRHAGLPAVACPTVMLVNSPCEL